jgi:hypothetical protein
LNFSTATSQATKNLPFHFASEIKHWGSAQKKKKKAWFFLCLCDVALFLISCRILLQIQGFCLNRWNVNSWEWGI